MAKHVAPTRSKMIDGVETHRQRDTGTMRSVGPREVLGIDGDAEFKYATVCEDHGTFILSNTRALANKAFSMDFCDYCREEARVALKAAVGR